MSMCPGPLAHGIEAVSVGRGLVGEGGVCPNSKQFGVKLGSKTIAAFAVAHEMPVEVQVAVDQQGGAGVDACVVQPLSWAETAEAAHRHLCGQVARDPVLLGICRGWGPVGQGGCDSFFGCWAQRSQRGGGGGGRDWWEGWLRGETPGPPLFRGVLREAWVVGKQRVGPMRWGPPQRLSSRTVQWRRRPRSPVGVPLQNHQGSPLGRGRQWSSEAGPVRPEQWRERLALLQGERGEGERGGEGIGVGAPEFSELVSLWRAVAKPDMLSSRAWRVVVERARAKGARSGLGGRVSTGVGGGVSASTSMPKWSSSSNQVSQIQRGNVGRRVILGWRLCQCISLTFCSILQWLGPPVMGLRFLLLHA